MKNLLFLIIVCSMLFGSATASAQKSRTHPNIIIILADDMGNGDASVYNPTSEIYTPHIDQLASQGMRFTDGHSPDAVCSPTRYGILTGRYSWRSRLKAGVLWEWDPPLIKNDLLTLPEMLKKQGYSTAAIGKWHLGWNWPTSDGKSAKKVNGKNVDYSKAITGGPLDQGFDYYYGDDVPNFPPYTFIHNQHVVTMPTAIKPDSMFGHKGAMAPGWRLDQVMPSITQKSVDMIDSVGQSGNKNPLFLYFALTAPHKPIVPTKRFQDTTNIGRYGDYVKEVDWTVGEVIEALKRNGMDENTILVFTSDNGSYEREVNGHDPSNGFRGIKGDAWEGGHREPLIVRWPNHIREGAVSNEMVSSINMMATIADVINYNLPEDAAVDSYSMLPLLEQKNPEGPVMPAAVFHSQRGRFVIRQNEWKLVLWPGSGGRTQPKQQNKENSLPKYQLYNMQKDPKELYNVSEKYPELVNHLREMMIRYVKRGRSTPGRPQKNDTGNDWPQLEYWMKDH